MDLRTPVPGLPSLWSVPHLGRPVRGVRLAFGGPARDPYPRAPLWLRCETRHGRVWAYDLRRLDLVRRCVAAGPRERAPGYDTGRKTTLFARPPSWTKSARNRDEVLRAIERLRATVVRPG
ncbi:MULTISPECIES: hypothetical protein [Streptomyces]|uniref:Transposase n=1 Tax=Streptomyces canarius TaxID=285453 RepID=A0ABQ3CRK2_9ACTN|nr:hypothetical protein [Streptomyces canarius]GHA39471.1 hypothetical protein GCM10010345_50110 [Streptomyces canarius]